MKAAEISKMIDHSLLHPTMTDVDILNGCHLAMSLEVATVCVKPYAVALASSILKGSSTEVCSVIGFPHGNNKTSLKVVETVSAMEDGASEIDMVVNIGKVKGNDWAYISSEIRTLNEVVVSMNGILKVIFENDYLIDEEIIQLCEICSQVQVAFVKTSTGYGFVRQNNGFYQYQGATDAQLTLMRANCSGKVQIKAAGGIRTLDDVLRVRSLGVTRVGATATKSIMDEAKSRFDHQNTER